MLWCHNRFFIKDYVDESKLMGYWHYDSFFVFFKYWDDKSKFWKLVATTDNYAARKYDFYTCTYKRYYDTIIPYPALIFS